MGLLSPDEVLFDGEPVAPVISSCEHVAGTERTMRRSLELQREMGGAFDVTLDLEDGAPAGAEEEHARLMASLLAGTGGGPGRVGVRVHDRAHPSFASDLERIMTEAGDRVAYVTIPKARSRDDAERALDALGRMADRMGRPAWPVHVLIETHGALRDVGDIAGLPGVETLDFGLMDFVSAHHGAIPPVAMTSPGQFEHALVRRAKADLAAAAHSAGVVPAHNVTVAFRDAEATAADARRAREELGFLRMWSIHPAQIRPILDAFAPDGVEIGVAVEVLAAAQDAGWGPISLGDRLHDRGSYRHCWSVLKRAKAAGLPLPGAAARFFR